MKRLRSGLVLLLSLMIFITSSGMTVNLHYCAGHLQEVSLNALSQHCNMESKITKKPCDAPQKNSILKQADTCCKNKHIVAKAETKVSPTKQKNQSSFSQTFVFINHYFTSLFNFSADDEKEPEKESNISVFPLLKHGLYILLQQFRK